MNRSKSFGTTLPTAGAMLMVVVTACGGPDPSAPGAAKQLVPGLDRPFEPRRRIDAEVLERFRNGLSLGSQVEVVELPMLGDLPRNPSVREFEGTLAELRALSPRLVFDELSISRLQMHPEEGIESGVEIRARVLTVTGGIFAAESACEPATLSLRASEAITVSGAIDVSSSVRPECAGDGGAIRVGSPFVTLEGQIIARGAACGNEEECRPGRGGHVEIVARDRLTMGPHAAVDVSGGAGEASAGTLDVESADVRQRFDGRGPHLMMLLGPDQLIEGRAETEYLGDDLARCADAMSVDANGESFYAHAVESGSGLRVVVPEGVDVIAFGAGECLEPHPVEGLGQAIEVANPSDFQLGIVAPEDQPQFGYHYRVETLR
jgi:hypothetical protein